MKRAFIIETATPLTAIGLLGCLEDTLGPKVISVREVNYEK